MVKKLLAVDHDIQRRDHLKQLLLEGGIEVLEAASCEEALEAVLQGDIPLVVTETDLPSKSGLYLLKSIKDRKPEVEVILITHNASSFTLLQALRNGAYDFIVRPIDTGEILHSGLQRAFRQIQLRQENRRLMETLEQQNRSLKRAHMMLQALNKSIERLAASMDMESLFMELLTCAMTELNAERGFLALFDRGAEKISLKVGKGIATSACTQYANGIPPGLTVTMAKRGKPVLIPAVFPQPLAEMTSEWERNSLIATNGLLAAPLKRNGRVLGLVVISGNLNVDKYCEQELNFLIQLAHYTVLSLEKVGIIHHLKRGKPIP